MGLDVPTRTEPAQNAFFLCVAASAWCNTWGRTLCCTRTVQKDGCFSPPVAMGPRVLNSARYRGVFTQRGHSTNYYGDYLGNNPENHPPAESCTINSKLKNSII